MDSQSNQKILTLTLALCLFLVSPLRAEVLDKIIATVNQEPITQSELRKTEDTLSKQLKDDKKALNPSEQAELKNYALSRLIDETLLKQQIEKSQIKVSESELKQALDSILKRNNMNDEALKKDLSGKGLTLEQYKEDIRKQMVRLRYFSQNFGSKIKVSDEEVNAYYSQNVAKTSNDQKVKIAQIVLPFSSEEDRLKVEKEATSLYEKVKSGKNFDQAMKERSAAGSGDLGEIAYSGLSPELSNAVAKLAKGQVSEPFKTSSAYLIVKLLDKPQAQLQAADDIKASIRDKIYEYKMQDEIKKYIEKIKKDAFIQVKL